MRSAAGRALVLGLAAIAAALGQSTQGLISGRVLDRQSGDPVAGARVEYSNATNDATGATTTDAAGRYAFPLLSPGAYRVQVEHARYQGQSLELLDLSVAAFLGLDFRLRPIEDVWERGRLRGLLFQTDQTVLTFYGPDVDTTKTAEFDGDIGVRGGLEATISQVIDARLLRTLPLSGRDAYTLLITQPGVTSDVGTLRSLGLSVNGQRPSASNFLLDGIENNDALVSGPLTVIAPEAIQEYRISTNNFSAEYGRTSGFLANAITPSGGSEWHGSAYVYGGTGKLDAGDWQRNAQGLDRAPLDDWQPGGTIGGPLRRGSLFGSLAFDALRLRTRQEEQRFDLPTAGFINALGTGTLARSLLQQFAPPQIAKSAGGVTSIVIAPPASVNRISAVPRVDLVTRGGADRFYARTSVYRMDRPDMIYSPYAGFDVPLKQNSTSTAVSWVRAHSARLTHELRLGYSDQDFRVDRPHPEVPQLLVTAGAGLPFGVDLPGSVALYSFRNHSRDTEFSGNVVWTADRHLVKAGVGMLWRAVDGYLTPYRDGQVFFNSLADFAKDEPARLSLTLNRIPAGSRTVPDFNRAYRYPQWNAFVEDSVRITGRLSVSYGIRYDRFGPPTSVGSAKDPVVSLGAGATEGERIAAATMSPAPSGNQKIYASDNVDLAVRTGASYALWRGGRTAIRGGYGIYYDRPFDNLWQSLRNNNWLQLEAALPATGPINYLQPAHLLDSLATLPVDRDAPDVTLYSSNFRAPRVHSGFAAIQHRLHERWFIEATVQASRSGDLVTTDRWNRQDSQTTFTRDNPNARFNGALPDILYRANQGRSQYRAFTSLVRYQGSAALFQASYTLSNSHDNQSDPIAGEFYDLRANKAGLSSQATFARQFDPDSNQGHADFDQRHNLVLFGIWELPRLARGWRVSALAAVRSGFPFTVLSPLIFGSPLLHNPANLVEPDAVSAGHVPVPGKGGVLLLNAAAFAPAGPVLGDSGRNRFYGPGLFNTDVSLSRRFGLQRLGESKAIAIRADAFNVLNHANLNNPNSSLGSPNFGLATYGRTARPQAFPLTTPFEETGREIRGMLTFEF